jgi:hypothetical protein
LAAFALLRLAGAERGFDFTAAFCAGFGSGRAGRGPMLFGTGTHLPHWQCGAWPYPVDVILL